MARPREPIALIQAKGKKNLTKEEIARRTAEEVQPCPDGIAAPAYLTDAQRRRFDLLADQLKRINIMGETDSETLARYVTAQSFYEQATKDLRAFLAKKRPDMSDPFLAKAWADAQDALARQQDRYFKQAQTVASSLGLTISARCKLVVPVDPEPPKQNKFAKFSGGSGK